MFQAFLVWTIISYIIHFHLFFNNTGLKVKDMSLQNILLDVMGQEAVAQIQISVAYLRVTVGIMKIALDLSYVEMIIVTLHILPMLTAAMILYQVCYLSQAVI